METEVAGRWCYCYISQGLKSVNDSVFSSLGPQSW